jgi:hypothetical protein
LDTIEICLKKINSVGTISIELENKKVDNFSGPVIAQGPASCARLDPYGEPSKATSPS